jgi:hypothetical protein
MRGASRFSPVSWNLELCKPLGRQFASLTRLSGIAIDNCTDGGKLYAEPQQIDETSDLIRRRSALVSWPAGKIGGDQPEKHADGSWPLKIFPRPCGRVRVKRKYVVCGWHGAPVAKLEGTSPESVRMDRGH